MMPEKSTLPLFHFLFCELIEQCYKNHHEQNYLDSLKKAGADIGFKIYTLICIRRQIAEKPTSIAALVRNIQTKVFKYLFNYEAANTYTATQDKSETQKEFYHVIVDGVSLYLVWMPEHLWDTSVFFAGLIEGICRSSGLECEVTSATKSESSGETFETEYFIKISEAVNQQWKENQ